MSFVTILTEEQMNFIRGILLEQSVANAYIDCNVLVENRRKICVSHIKKTQLVELIDGCVQKTNYFNNGEKLNEFIDTIPNGNYFVKLNHYAFLILNKICWNSFLLYDDMPALFTVLTMINETAICRFNCIHDKNMIDVDALIDQLENLSLKN